jgi:hypothetical protein
MHSPHANTLLLYKSCTAHLASQHKPHATVSKTKQQATLYFATHQCASHCQVLLLAAPAAVGIQSLLTCHAQLCCLLLLLLLPLLVVWAPSQTLHCLERPRDPQRVPQGLEAATANQSIVLNLNCTRQRIDDAVCDKGGGLSSAFVLRKHTALISRC